MILNLIKPYFKTHLATLDFKYWPDPFDFDNVPADIVDRAAFISIGTIQGGGKNQNAQPFTVPVVVRLAVRGYADVDAADDASLVEIDRMICEATKNTNRFGTTGIKDVVFRTATRRVLNTENDTAVISEIEFEVKLFSKE